MSTNRQLELLTDWRRLKLAYAASSDYVLRLSFERIPDLQVFRERPDLAPAVLAQYEQLKEREVVDPVILDAHLYALELAGAPRLLRKAIAQTLSSPQLRANSEVAQFAAKIGVQLIPAPRKLAPDAIVEEQEISELARRLGEEEQP